MVVGRDWSAIGSWEWRATGHTWKSVRDGDPQIIKATSQKTRDFQRNPNTKENRHSTSFKMTIVDEYFKSRSETSISGKAYQLEELIRIAFVWKREIYEKRRAKVYELTHAMEMREEREQCQFQ
jgi:hypothetical protein